MLKNSLCILLTLLGLFSAGAVVNPDENRVVLSMPRQFDKIVINGNVTAEIVFHKEHKGYVVYNVSDTLAPKIHCVVDSARTLVLSGSETDHSVKSRVVVVACDSVTSIINNEAGTVLIKKLPRVADLCMISNGSGTIKCGHLSADHLMLTNNSNGTLLIKEAKAKFIDVYGNSAKDLSVKEMRCHGTRILNNADGTLTVNDLKSRRGEIINNADGTVNVAGSAKAFAVVNYSGGSIDISGFSCKKINKANYGTGNIK